MNKKIILLPYLLSVLFLFGCKSTSTTSEEIKYNPFVEAFTSGMVSRQSPVYLIFNEDIESDKLKADQLKKLVKIKPSVKGEFSFENERTVVFKPETEFSRDTEYEITADLTKWFDAQGEDKEFKFRFSTQPLDLRANFESLGVGNSIEEGYEIVCRVNSSDYESAETVESLIKLSEKTDVSWSHSQDGNTHTLTLKGVSMGDDTRMITISLGKNKLGAKEKDLLDVEVPGKNSFVVYNVNYVSDPERYVEITFSQNIDPAQKLKGLAYIDNNKSESVSVDGNKLKLYPDSQQSETLRVHLSKGIRSSLGLELQEDVVRELDINPSVPSVAFVGNGVIVPQSTPLTVPFKAIYLRGVIVNVIKVLEKNMGQFLQVNSLDGSDELMRVGRLITRKVIFLDENGMNDLTQWNTYAIDLSELIKPEPGAIYRLELSFDKDLSIYPCDEESVKLTKEQILAKNEVRFKEDLSRFNEGGYYYYGGYYNWSDYNYEEREDPCSNSFYYNLDVVSKNVLVTNLGLIAMAGQDNNMTVLVHNLITTNPESGVAVTAYNYQNQELASGTTDASGKVDLTLAKGKPFYLIASLGSERSYLRVDAGSALSVSTFDVSGEVVQKGIKGFIYGERGVWRPGDTLHLGFMLNDRAGTLPKEHPVVMELYNPLGQLYLTKTQTTGKLGVYSFSFPTDPDALTGLWEAKINVGGVAFTKRLRIETIKPNRLKIDLKIADKLLRNKSIDGKMHVEWLHGATARNLKYDIQGTFVPVQTTFDKFKDFVFDDPTKQFTSEESNIISGTTDESGNANISGSFDTGSEAPGALMVNLVTRVYEESGDFSIDAVRTTYYPYGRFVGIKSPQKGRDQLDTGKKHDFEVASVDYEGNPQSGVGIEVNVYKVSWYWWWNSNNNMLANYMSDSYNESVRHRKVTTGSDGKATFSLEFENGEWGTYFISVKDASGKHSAGVMSYFDWPYNEGRRDREGSETATTLTIKTDKDSYAPGEKMVLTFPSPKGSRAIVSIENGSKVLSISEHECGDRETALKIDVTKDMQPNAYIHVTLLQPHGNTKNDLPIRMYGIVPFTVTSPDSYLNPVIDIVDKIKPESDYTITISEKNGRQMAYTLAVVDEGLLDLTRFQTPQPWKTFNAREALGVSSWDLYNYVVGAYGGRIEQLFSIGGDDAINGGAKAIVNRFKPVVRFEGPFILDKGSKQKHTYKMSNYVGRVRVMVVAGDGYAYGNADKSVQVSKPVMLLGTLPRVIGTNEEMVVPATVFATEDGVGNVKVSIECSDNMEVIGQKTMTLNFSGKGDKQTGFRVKVKGKPGAAHVKLVAEGKGDKSVYETDIEVRSVRTPQTKVKSIVLEPGKTFNEKVNLPGAEGTNKLTVEVSNIRPINLASRLSYLIGYPHGCLEQITSKGFPQLYVKQFASLTKGQENSIENNVKEVIRRFSSYQFADGAFAYWPGGSNINSWGSIYASHFMLEAEAKGYLVPEKLKKSALNNLHYVARNWKSESSYYAASEETTQAYRLYVLALSKSPETGAMNRLKEQKSLNRTGSAFLAAAYVLIGREDVANELMHNTKEVTNYDSEYDGTYGSATRDKAVQLITLTLQNKATEAALLVKDLSDILASDQWLSTQSTSFALLAVSEYVKKYNSSESIDFSYSCGGKKDKVSVSKKNVWSEMILDKAQTTESVELKNTGDGPLFVNIICEGIPEQGNEEAYSNGILLTVNYEDAKGNTLDVSELEQGTNFTAIVTVKNPTVQGYNHITLSEIFPAGWEILNARFLGNESSASGAISYQDFRDDRVYTYIDHLPGNRQVTVRINLCAVYPGQFYLPPVSSQAMYNNLIKANTEGKEVIVK